MLLASCKLHGVYIHSRHPAAATINPTAAAASSAAASATCQRHLCCRCRSAATAALLRRSVTVPSKGLARSASSSVVLGSKTSAATAQDAEASALSSLTAKHQVGMHLVAHRSWTYACCALWFTGHGRMRVVPCGLRVMDVCVSCLVVYRS